MKFFIKIALISFSILLILVSCKTRATSAQSFVGKTFYLKNDNTPAQYGGKQFITFKEDHLCEYKTGDIMNIGSYQVKEGILEVKNNRSGEILNFEIVSSSTIKLNQSEYVLQ